MESKSRISSHIHHRPSRKFNEEKSDGLWSLFDMRLPALCHQLLTGNQSKDPHATYPDRSKQNDLHSRPKKRRSIMVKSAKCQVDLIPDSKIPREADTTLAKMPFPKRLHKRKQMEKLPPEYNNCLDQKTLDRHSPELYLTEKGTKIKPLPTITYGILNDLKDDGCQHNMGFTNLDVRKIRTGNNEDGLESEIGVVDKGGAQSSAGFQGRTTRERENDSWHSTTEISSQQKRSKAEFPQTQNRIIDTNQTSELKNDEEQADGTVHINQISETDCLKEEVHTNQIQASESELSKDQKNTVQINKQQDTLKLDYILNHKQPKYSTNRKCTELPDNRLTNNTREYEPIKPMKTCITYENRDTLINEPDRHNKRETIIMSTDESDTSINDDNVTTETWRNDASDTACTEAEDTTIKDNDVSETDKNSLSETVCKEELDNAANEQISKAGCKEEQDNIANNEKNTSETMLTEQHNNNASSKDSEQVETNKNDVKETYDKVAKRNNTTKTKLSEQLENISKNCKITIGYSDETECSSECDMNNLSLKLGLDVLKEATETLGQTQNVTIKEESSHTEGITSQRSKSDDLIKTELATQMEMSDIHKIEENEDTITACYAARKEQNNNKNQQQECRTKEQNDKLETESLIQKEQETSESEQETSESECKSEPELSQQEHRKQHDKSQQECRKEKHNSTQQEASKEEELNTQQIKSSKTRMNVNEPEYKKEHKTSQLKCTTDVKIDDIDNELKLVTENKLDCDKRQNNTSATRHHHEQITTAETTDLQAHSREWPSERVACEAIKDQQNNRTTREWAKCEGAIAKIETDTDVKKLNNVSTSLESHQQTGIFQNQDRSDLVDVYDKQSTHKAELSNLDHPEVSTTLLARNDNKTHQTADNSNLGTHYHAFEAEKQTIIVEKAPPLCNISAKTDAVSDSTREANQISTPNSTKNHLKSSAKTEVMVLLPPVCNSAAKNPTEGISGMRSGSTTCAIAIPWNITPAKESRAFTQMISRRVSAYVLDSKTNMAAIVPLDSSINYSSIEQGENESAVFSEDIYFQNCRLWCQNAEARPRRVSSIDPRYLQSNQIEELRSGSSRRSRSESLTRRCALNKEWEILTKTTREELTIFSPPKQSSKTLTDTVNSQECYPKCSVNNNSIKLQDSQASSPVHEILHESIQQPISSSSSVDNKKSNRDNNQTKLGPIGRQLSVDNATEMDGPISCSTGKKAGNDVPGSSAVHKYAAELFTGVMQECIKQLAGSYSPENLETPVYLDIDDCSFVDTSTSNKLTTNICQQCGDSSMISWSNTNKNPLHSEALPDICMKTNHELPLFGPTDQDFFETDEPTSDLNSCDTEMLEHRNSKQSTVETGYDSTENELSVANDGSSDIPIKRKYQDSHLTGNRDMSFGEKTETFSKQKTQVSGDFYVEEIDSRNLKAKDVIQCKSYESREVFTQTDTSDFTEQSQPAVTQHAAHSASDPQKTNFKDRNCTAVDDIRFQKNVYSPAQPMKYTPTEETRNDLEKLEFIQNCTTHNPTPTNCIDMSQTGIRLGGVIAKELAGYIFYKDKRNSRTPFRTNFKGEMKRSSSLSDVQTDLQNSLILSEKLGTLIATGQTVLVLKLPPGD